MLYKKDYLGFVYIWYNRAALIKEKTDFKNGHGNRQKRKHPRLYIGSHMGSVDDGYICSSQWMCRSYKKNPQNFMRRIIYWQKTDDDVKELLTAEQRYLNMIEDHELGTRFYNLVRLAGPGGKWTEKAKQKKSKDMKRSWNNNPTRKEVYRQIFSELNGSPERREHFRQKNYERFSDPIEKEKQSVRAKAMLANPEIMARRKLSQQRYWRSEEGRRRLDENRRKRWQKIA